MIKNKPPPSMWLERSQKTSVYQFPTGSITSTTTKSPSHSSRWSH